MSPPDVVGAGAEVGAHGQAAQVAVLQHHHLLDVGAGEVLLIMPRLGHAAETGQAHMRLTEAGLVIVVELGDEVDDLHRLLGVGSAVEGEGLLIKVGHKHGDLLDVEHAAGGDDVALARGHQEDLIVLLPGIGLRGEVRAGLEGHPLHGGVLVGALQDAHAGHAVGILVLDISTS